MRRISIILLSGVLCCSSVLADTSQGGFFSKLFSVFKSKKTAPEATVTTGKTLNQEVLKKYFMKIYRSNQAIREKLKDIVAAREKTIHNLYYAAVLDYRAKLGAQHGKPDYVEQAKEKAKEYRAKAGQYKEQFRVLTRQLNGVKTWEKFLAKKVNFDSIGITQENAALAKKIISARLQRMVNLRKGIQKTLSGYYDFLDKIRKKGNVKAGRKFVENIVEMDVMGVEMLNRIYYYQAWENYVTKHFGL